MSRPLRDSGTLREKSHTSPRFLTRSKPRRAILHIDTSLASPPWISAQENHKNKKQTQKTRPTTTTTNTTTTSQCPFLNRSHCVHHDRAWSALPLFRLPDVNSTPWWHQH
ncbi:hypothetical protein LX32DRAFT_44244 [Colletotrichum zoysiae]|uniref:Uncharacterized protein n=1 Tax=Colletotrichum zoysiae TaxID=1216348 RepID=A0AAD9HCL4_9PEZI|nr:hypothetical protein LX32DRAFT_44244 [Colletotrichum zoysiae]